MEQGYELRLIDINRAILEQSQPTEVYIPLQGKHTTNPEEVPFNLAEKIKLFFVFDDTNPRDPRVMLLMGDTGSGKSVFAHQLLQQLWQVRKENDPIPLWIPLPELLHPFENAVEEVLKKYEFSESQIAEMKERERFLFIVDGYDELHQFQNCYVTNKWNQWKAKVLIMCRSQALYYQKDPDKYFMPFSGDKKLPWLLRKLYVAPFSQDQIKMYLEMYNHKTSVQENRDYGINFDDFDKIPGLKELITTPFLLHLAVDALPDILVAQIDDQKITQAKLYDVFIEQWFSRQVKKFSASGNLKDTEQKTKQQCWDYCKRLAQKMYENEVSVIPYQKHKVGGRLFGKQEQSNSWEPFFNEDTKIVRSACPLKRFGDHNYGFFHASMIEYFATRAMYEEIQSEQKDRLLNAPKFHSSEAIEPVSSWRKARSYANNKVNLDNICGEFKVDTDHNNEMQNIGNQPHGGIHQRLFSLERQTIQFLADRIQMNEKFKQKMLSILNASKKNGDYIIGAANAVTALVKAGVTFNGADLSGIKISGAVISGGYFDNANFTGANLSQVRAFNVWLRASTLHDCNLEGINFGEYPFIKFNSRIKGIVYYPDMNRLLVGYGKKLAIWDTEKKEKIKEFRDTDYIFCVSMSNDGTTIASNTLNEGEDAKVSVWDVNSGRSVVLRGHNRQVTKVHLNGDGKIVASASNDHTIRLWDVSSGKEIAIHKVSPTATAIHLSLDAKKLIYATDKNVRIWVIGSNRKPMQLEGHTGEVRCLDMSLDFRLIVSGGHDHTVRLWDVASRQSINLQGHLSSVSSVKISEDGKTIISGSDDNTVRIWDVESKSSVVLLGHGVGIGNVLRNDIGSVSSVQISSDGKRAASAGDDGTVRFWDLNNVSDRVIKEEYLGSVDTVQLSADGVILAWSCRDKVHIWNTFLTQSITLFEDTKKKGKLIDMFLSADGKKVLTTYNRKDHGIYNTACMWNVVNGQGEDLEKRNESGGNQLICSKAHMSADAKIIVLGLGIAVEIWNVENNNLTKVLSDDENFDNVRVSQDGKTIVAWQNDVKFKITILDIPTGRKVTCKGHKAEILCGQLSVDSAILVTGSNDKTVRMWDAYSGQNKGVFQGHEADVYCVHISADCKTIISGGWDKTVRVWDVQLRTQIYIFNMPSAINSISVHDSLGLLAIGMRDSSVQLWKRLDGSGKSWQLNWALKNPNMNLSMGGCWLDGSIGLSLQNQELMSQLGAINVNQQRHNDNSNIYKVGEGIKKFGSIFAKNKKKLSSTEHIESKQSTERKFE